MTSRLSAWPAHRLQLLCALVLATLVTACSSRSAHTGEGATSPDPERDLLAALRRDAVAELALDLDGDGAKERVYLLHAPDTGALADPAVVIVDLHAAAESSGNADHGAAPDAGLLVIPGSAAPGSPRYHLLVSGYQPSFLASASRDDLGVVAGTALQADYPELAGRTPGSAIAVLTEAGIDIYVFWNGSGFELYEPEEMP